MRRTQSFIKNQKGTATVETVPVMFVFVLLISYTLGMFGVIHTGIMQSISARTYAFETFRNRSNLIYFRDTPTGELLHFKVLGNRIHGVGSETRPDASDQFEASARPIRMGLPVREPQNHEGGGAIVVHNEKVHESALIGFKQRNTQVQASPVWVMIQYGMCMNNACGD